jgi:chorismate dehydratase
VGLTGIETIPSMHPAIGSVCYLNAVPLTWGIEKEVLFATPSELAKRLLRDELDAALVSVTEVLLRDRYEVLDGVAIACQGTVKSVFLAHRVALEDVREIFLDTASLASVNLLKVLLRERGLAPRLRPLESYTEASGCDAVLLIGDRALEFVWAGHSHRVWDLGAAWGELTGLPFVYAVWVLRRGKTGDELRARLRAARDAGVGAIDEIVARRTEFDAAFRREYFRRHIYYALGEREKRGLAEFARRLAGCEVGPVYWPEYVS